jgi:dolichol-phosphate mannosyltransferase
MRPVVVVPTYNERANVTQLGAELLRHADVSVIIVDDDSPDGTGQEANRLAASSGGRVSVVHRKGPRGFRRSYIEGMKIALAGGATHIVQMDADFSHDPADVPRLLTAGREADLVVGSRYVAGGRVLNWPLRRMLLSGFANRYVRTITRMPVHDCTSGFRCWRRELLERLPFGRLVSDGYAFQVELTWEAFLAGARIVEVPIVFVERATGASKMSGRIIAESALLPWLLVARPRTRRG